MAGFQTGGGSPPALSGKKKTLCAPFLAVYPPIHPLSPSNIPSNNQLSPLALPRTCSYFNQLISQQNDQHIPSSSPLLINPTSIWRKGESSLCINKSKSADKTRLWTRRGFHTLRNLSSVRRHLIVSFRHGSQRGPSAAASILLVYFGERKAGRPVKAAIWSLLPKNKYGSKGFISTTRTIKTFCWPPYFIQNQKFNSTVAFCLYAHLDWMLFVLNKCVECFVTVIDAAVSFHVL